MPENNPPQAEMSNRTMLVLGGAGAVIVSAVLGVSLLLGVHANSTPEPAAVAPITVTPASSGSVAVPRLAGTGYITASADLRRLGLAVGSILRVPSSRVSGIVLRTYPDAGALVPAGSSVTLYVSFH